MKYICLAVLCAHNFSFPMFSLTHAYVGLSQSAKIFNKTRNMATFSEGQKELLEKRLNQLQCALEKEEENINIKCSWYWDPQRFIAYKVSHEIFISASMNRKLHIQDKIFETELILSGSKEDVSKEFGPSHAKIESVSDFKNK